MHRQAWLRRLRRQASARSRSAGRSTSPGSRRRARRSTRSTAGRRRRRSRHRSPRSAPSSDFRHRRRSPIRPRPERHDVLLRGACRDRRASSRRTRSPCRRSRTQDRAGPGTRSSWRTASRGNAGWGLKSAASVAAGGIEGYATAPSINKGQSVDLKVTPTNSAHVQRRDLPHGLLRRGRRPPDVDDPQLPAVPAAGLHDQRLDAGSIDCSTWSVSTSVTTTRVLADRASTCCASCATTTRNDNMILLGARRRPARRPPLRRRRSARSRRTTPTAASRSTTSTRAAANTVTSAPRAAKVSFDRPFEQTLDGQRDWYPQRRDRDGLLARAGGLRRRLRLEHRPRDEPRARCATHKAYISPAHDEYWSAAMRSALRAARDAGHERCSSPVRTRSTGRSASRPVPVTGSPTETQVAYKSHAERRRGPERHPDGHLARSGRHQRAGEQLSGAMYVGDNDFADFPLRRQRDAGRQTASGATRAWTRRLPGTSTTIGQNLVGWEWDARVTNGAEPAGVEDARRLAGQRQPDPGLRREPDAGRDRLQHGQVQGGERRDRRRRPARTTGTAGSR